MSQLLIIGAGGHGKVVADCATALNEYQQIAFLDDGFPGYAQVNRWDIIGKPEDFCDYIDDYWFFVAIGNNQARAKWHAKLTAKGARIASLIHPGSVIGLDVDIATGTLVLAGTVINTLCRIGHGCIINTGSTVDHDCCLGNYVHIAPGVHLAGSVSLADEVFMGVGSAAIPGVTVGKHSIVGAGATVIHDLPANITAVGTPAKISKQS